MRNIPGQIGSARLLLLFTIVLLLWPLAGIGLAQEPAAQDNVQQLAFGETETGFIGTPAEIDTYTFAADAGDRILLGASRSSGDLWPRIRLYQPGGLLLRDEDDATHVEVSQTLPVGGTYSLHISDGFNGTLTGGYGLYLQRLNAPGNATGVAFGQTTIGSISQPAEMDTYTFDAQADDAILVGISHASGDLWPQIRLYDPRGNLVGTEGDPDHAEITLNVSQRWAVYLPVVQRNDGGTTRLTDHIQQQGQHIPARVSFPGTYTILVADDLNGTLTGSYGLYVQRLNNPGNATAMSFGQTLAGSIDLAGEMDAYTFAATAGDVVLLGASNASGNVWPQVRLYDPVGNLVGIAGDPDHAEVQVTLDSSGTYAVLLSDDLNGTLTGGCGLHVQRLNNPGNQTPITFGQTLAGAINQAAEMDAFTFAADAGDVILIGASRSSDNVWTQIRLFDPGGNLVGIAHDPDHAEVQVVIANSGTHTILIADYLTGALTGDYGLHVQRLNDPGNATALAYGDLVPATLDMAAEMDAYTFVADAGDSVLISMARTSGTLWPQIRLFGPEGASVGTASGATLAELNATLTESGTHTILVADDLNGRLTGGYNLQLQQTGR